MQICIKIFVSKSYRNSFYSNFKGFFSENIKNLNFYMKLTVELFKIMHTCSFLRELNSWKFNQTVKIITDKIYENIMKLMS